MGISKFLAVLIFALVVVVTVMVTSRVAEAQVTSRVAEVQVTSCASSLAPCANYTNGTGTPPASCCTPLKESVNDVVLFQCLCNLYANNTKATDLPARCQIYLFCPSGSGVGRIAWAGLPSLLFFWASMVLY
ncbi:hypothetical protein Vadar_014908 [Vaccinium darrowii]|uniref:Uncharacterized protein n=1 Tax=Vaccinium darrowii TaxID=229202 RepID=A0ACB7ZDW7_9ERIC|nr:hypothetical protein Vadar_014908 [Vaccinium darrowii]